VLQNVAVCCCVLQCVTVCCTQVSFEVLQCVAVCSCVLQCVARTFAYEQQQQLGLTQQQHDAQQRHCQQIHQKQQAPRPLDVRLQLQRLAMPQRCRLRPSCPICRECDVTSFICVM